MTAAGAVGAGAAVTAAGAVGAGAAVTAAGAVGVGAAVTAVGAVGVGAAVGAAAPGTASRITNADHFSQLCANMRKTPSLRRVLCLVRLCLRGVLGCSLIKLKA